MIEDVKAKVTELISLYEREKLRADNLAVRLEASQNANKAYKMQITELNEQIDNLKLLGAFNGGGDNTLAKERISKLIKEIDRCIKLLEE